ncbi:unnamed protein product [Closterium sp. NIES-64]|nr:unnamed protein product [Closterium sp. NIES-64]
MATFAATRPSIRVGSHEEQSQHFPAALSPPDGAPPSTVSKLAVSIPRGHREDDSQVLPLDLLHHRAQRGPASAPGGASASSRGVTAPRAGETRECDSPFALVQSKPPLAAATTISNTGGRRTTAAGGGGEAPRTGDAAGGARMEGGSCAARAVAMHGGVDPLDVSLAMMGSFSDRSPSQSHGGDVKSAESSPVMTSSSTCSTGSCGSAGSSGSSGSSGGTSTTGSGGKSSGQQPRGRKKSHSQRESGNDCSPTSPVKKGGDVSPPVSSTATASAAVTSASTARRPKPRGSVKSLPTASSTPNDASANAPSARALSSPSPRTTAPPAAPAAAAERAPLTVSEAVAAYSSREANSSSPAGCIRTATITTADPGDAALASTTSAAARPTSIKARATPPRSHDPAAASSFRGGLRSIAAAPSASPSRRSGVSDAGGADAARGAQRSRVGKTTEPVPIASTSSKSSTFVVTSAAGAAAKGNVSLAAVGRSKSSTITASSLISTSGASNVARRGAASAPNSSMPFLSAAAAAGAAAMRAAGVVPVATAAAKCFGPGSGGNVFGARMNSGGSSSDEGWTDDEAEPEREEGAGEAEQRVRVGGDAGEENRRWNAIPRAATGGNNAPSRGDRNADALPSVDAGGDAADSVAWGSDNDSDCSSDDWGGFADGGEARRRGTAQVEAAERSECRRFSLAQLQQATGNFDDANLLGRGAFGRVYKGHLMGCEVAVKRLDGDGWQGPDEYCTELRVLSHAHHPHIVLLMGHCPAAMCLVYEYLPGGSLADYLVGGNGTSGGTQLVTPSRPALHWSDRVRILSEVAGALVFLHHSDPPVAHRDLKPHNVLLDLNLRTKLADVGLARLIDTSADAGGNMTARVRGTAGYIDPEEVVTCEISVTSDVYALGIIMLQLLTGYSNVNQVHKLLASASASAVSAAGGGGGGGYLEMIASHLDPAAGAWPLPCARALASLAMRCACRQRRLRPDLATEVHPALMRLSSHAARSAAASATASAANGGPGAAASPASAGQFEGKGGDRGGKTGGAVVGADGVRGTEIRWHGTDGTHGQLLCPLSKAPISEPVVAADGFTYEQHHMQQWLASSSLSPVTGQPLPHTFLTPNVALKLLS